MVGLKVSDVGIRVEDYLTTIYRLQEVYGHAKTTNISRELNVRPATVSKVINYLKRKGLVDRVKYRGVTLTGKGREVAEEVVRRHRIAETFLAVFLGFDIYEAHLYAHHFEHLPKEVIERIYERMSRPTTCPHGNYIPGVMAGATVGVKLTEVDEGRQYVVVRIAGELIKPLKMLRGLALNSLIRVVERTPFYTVVELGSGELVELPSDVAETVYVSNVRSD